MPFQIQPLNEFLVRPALPARIVRLGELAYNLVWSWDHSIRALFRRLDPVLWKQSNHNPVWLLSCVPQQTLEKAAADPRFLALYDRAMSRYDEYLKRHEPTEQPAQIAYFSMEYGLIDCMPIYSGGLGVLSGDHLKASSDAAIPLVGVGLLYQKGYLQQSLNPDGWQQERNPVNDFYSLPVRPVQREDGSELLVSVDLPRGRVQIKVWQITVGTVRLFLLDTNIPENQALGEYRDITDHLYGGDATTRIQQEIVLGIGGLRALQAIGVKPTVFHMNEGHSAFLAIERIRTLMLEANLTFEEALEATRHNNVFTTHTSVPAGIDLFDTGLLYEYFHAYCEQAGIPFEKLVALGRQRPEDPQDNFSMAVLAIQTSSYRNAVSLLHRHVSQEMWQELWPDLPTWEVPITSVTNGVHLPSWVNGDLAALYDTYLQPDWRDRYAGDPNTWDMIDEIPNQELWEAHKRRKRRLVAFVRERGVAAAHARKAPLKEIKQLEQVLDPEAFTIGFARRFATYKRATLLFRDIERLKRIITNSKRPVQIIIAGKAHPRDIPGKTLIREIVQWSRDASLSKHVVFLEDYGIQVARELVQGVDLWLNNPRRGEEACGTSGMKAGLNGVLNLSILDGWYDEAYEQSGGWAIGDREPYSPELDDVHATSVYSMLENEILPTYYEERDGDVPVDWMKRVKQCMKHVSAQFNCQRMIQDYWTQLYEPAHRNYVQVSQNNFAYARKRNEWTGIVRHCWPNVRFLQVGPGPDPTVTSGREIPLSATLDLAGLGRDDVRVEALVGKVGPGGELEQTQVLTLDPMDQDGTVFRYGREFVPHQTGRLGYAFRVTPNHYDDPLNRPCRPLLKWGGLRAD